MLFTGCECGSKLWAVIATLAALDLDELGRQRPLPAIEIVGHSLGWASSPSPDSPCRSVETRRYETHLPLCASALA